MTNLVSPYRIPLFTGLGKNFSTTVVIGKQESNRPEWPKGDQELEEQGVTLRELKGFLFKRSEDKFVHVNPSYLSFLFRESPDAVISFELGFRTVCALVYSIATGRPLWIWSEGTSRSEATIGTSRRFIRQYLSRARARWITLGTESTDYLESLGIPTNRILRLQNGVDNTLFTVKGNMASFEGPRPLLLVVGQLVERKGIENLLAAAGRLQKRGETFSLRFIGSGPRRESLEQLARSLGLSQVEFYGGLGADDLPAHYRSADVLVFPTLEDVWGLVANEALLCGTPVLCSKYAGCAHDLLDDENIFDPLSAADFDRALLKAIHGKVTKPNTDRIWSMDRIVSTLCEDIADVLNCELKP